MLLVFSFGSVAPLSPLDVPFAALLTVGSAEVSFVCVSSSSTILSGFGPGVMSGETLAFVGDSLAGDSLTGDDLVGDPWLGDSGIGSLAKFVLKGVAFFAMFSTKGSFLSAVGAGVVFSVSLLILLLDTDTESPLFCR